MLRKYEANDLDDLLDVWETASAEAHPFLSESFVASERKNISQLYLPNSETWVVETQERVVAFISLLGDEVGGLFVHPSHQRQGLGGRLLAKARELRGDLEVEVFVNNPIGRSFYADSGFTLVSESVHAPTGQKIMRLRLLN